MSSLLARYADCIFWMARYVERAENLARILDVTQAAARRHGSSSQDWAAILEINSDWEEFHESGRAIDGDTVVHFYLLDAANPTSILYALTCARENARTLRPFISTEMWSQLNVAYNWLRTLRPGDLTPPERPRLLATVKEYCQTHTGITEGTFFRDQGWYFHNLGRYIERADQTTRLLDVKFHRLGSVAPTAPLEAGRGRRSCAQRRAITPSGGSIRAASSSATSSGSSCSTMPFRVPCGIASTRPIVSCTIFASVTGCAAGPRPLNASTRSGWPCPNGRRARSCRRACTTSSTGSSIA